MIASTLIASFLLTLSTAADTDVSAADKAWSSFSRSYNQQPGTFYRENGLKFWNDFPNDPRRYKWLISTIGHNSRPYVLDIEAAEQAYRNKDYATYWQLPSDAKKEVEWKDTYARMRKEFFDDPKVMDSQHWVLCDQELFWEIAAARSAWKYRGELIDVERLQQSALRFASDYPNYFRPQYPAMFFFAYPDQFGLSDPQKMLKFIEPFKRSPNSQLVEYVLGQERVAKLGEEPLELSFTSVDGQQVDLTHYKGKVVFIDIWGPGCTTCVERMPRTQELYDKYRKDGLEVVGICLRGADYEDKCLAMLQKGQAKWANWFQTASETEELTDRFSIRGVPVTLLIGRDGRLITSNPNHATLESTFRKALGLPVQ